MMGNHCCYQHTYTIVSHGHQLLSVCCMCLTLKWCRCVFSCALLHVIILRACIILNFMQMFCMLKCNLAIFINFFHLHFLCATSATRCAQRVVVVAVLVVTFAKSHWQIVIHFMLSLFVLLTLLSRLLLFFFLKA